MNLLAHFQHKIRALDIGDKVVIGVSGGPDSVALLHLFVESQPVFDFRLQVVHVNHMIRGQESDGDEAFVVELAKQWDIPCRVEKVDVPALAADQKLSIEAAARLARYTTLTREAIRSGASVIAVAHHAGDQAETVLMHILRGSGLAGLRGMQTVGPIPDAYLPAETSHRPLLIRPLLDVPREVIDAYCTEHGLNPRLDHTNLDTAYARNRLRHELIPALERVNPAFQMALNRMASVLAADYDLIQQQIDQVWERIVTEKSEHLIRLDRDTWRELPLALQRETIRRAVEQLRESLSDLGFKHIEQAVQVAQGGQNRAQAILPGGLQLWVDYDSLVIESYKHQPARPDWPLLEPGTVLDEGQLALPGSPWLLQLSRYDGELTGPTWDALIADPWSALLAIPAASPTFQLRARQPGDRFQPQGAGGSQKLSDFMINAKIPAVWRDYLPLLLVDDQIAWVSGWRVDQRFVVDPNTDRDIWLARFEKTP